MITLASYPRSGVTFLRNVLFEVYGIPSATFHNESHGPDDNWEVAPVVKTHLRQNELPDVLKQRPVVYLIRDGRDALVSEAHHRSDIITPGSPWSQNLMESIYASDNSHFGGWSGHVRDWWKHAEIVIHFEELVADPIGQCERLRPYLRMASPNLINVPSFEQLKSGDPQYGSGRNIGKSLADKWFRRGMVNGWKDEMSVDQQKLFWHLHGEVMELMGYGMDGTHIPAMIKKAEDAKTKINVIIEADKLREGFTDGIGRYVRELIKSARDWPVPGMRVQVLVGDLICTPDEALARHSEEHSTRSNCLRTILKNVGYRMLSESTYHRLARLLKPLLEKRVQTSIPESRGSKHFADIVLLTLPQHFDRIEDINARVVGVVHDLSHKLYPEHHTFNNVELCNKGMHFLSKNSDKIIAVSTQTKQSLKKINFHSEVVHLGVDRQRFFPNHNAHLPDFIRKRYNLPTGRFILSLCTLEPRKNIRNLIKAYSRLDESFRYKHPLVLAGRKGWKWRADIVPASVKKNIHFTGYINEAHLPCLYTMAHVFVYPSLYEGFGLPVLEALACGCPVACASNSSLPEVAGGSAEYFDPNNIEEIAAILAKTSRDETQTHLRTSALQQTWKFSWARCWLETSKLLSEEVTSSEP